MMVGIVKGSLGVLHETEIRFKGWGVFKNISVAWKYLCINNVQIRVNGIASNGNKQSARLLCSN